MLKACNNKIKNNIIKENIGSEKKYMHDVMIKFKTKQSKKVVGCARKNDQPDSWSMRYAERARLEEARDSISLIRSGRKFQSLMVPKRKKLKQHPLRDRGREDKSSRASGPTSAKLIPQNRADNVTEGRGPQGLVPATIKAGITDRWIPWQVTNETNARILRDLDKMSGPGIHARKDYRGIAQVYQDERPS